MKFLFAGEGGQGVQVAGEILAKAAFEEEKHSSYIPNFGVEQRGGVSLAFVRIEETPIFYPKFEKADVLAIFCDRAIERVENFIDKKTKLFFGPAVRKLPKVSIGFHLRGGTFPPKVWNILILGKIIKETKIVKLSSVKKAMEKRFAHHFAKNPKLKELDYKALEN